MTLPSPLLDDRTFAQLMEQVETVMAQRCPGWKPSIHDPGTVLLELFAHLTETMLYRVNRVPEKAHIELLRLAGVTLRPPSAASTTLRFWTEEPAGRAIEVPQGTRVTTSRPAPGEEPVVFVTDRAAVIERHSTEAQVTARHCEWVQGELAGWGTGQPGLSVAIRRPPIIARAPGEHLDLIVAVEIAPEAAQEPPKARVIQTGDGKSFHIWTEVSGFAASTAEDLHYVADRMSGTVTFAPAVRLPASNSGGDGAEAALEEQARALAAIPAAGREVRVWYRRGGGPAGNVDKHTLDTLKDPIAGVRVTNPEPATGGAAAETLDNARARAPIELHSQRRAVTARDFETLGRAPGIARTRAFTRSQRWAHAEPGTVEVRLVPDLPDRAPGQRVGRADLEERQSERQRVDIRRVLDDHRPLGTLCEVAWARYKEVRVEARLVVHPTADRHGVHDRVLARLHDAINPLPSAARPHGWPFGQPLYRSDVDSVLLAEPGVHHIEGTVRLRVDQAPGASPALCRDAHQPNTFYAGADEALFRTGNSGDSWERVGHFAGEDITCVAAHPGRAGLVAVATRAGDAHRVHMSPDCGETWPDGATETLDTPIHDIAWIVRGLQPILLLATDSGLAERPVRPDAPEQRVSLRWVQVAGQSIGLRSVATSPGAGGGKDIVALAALGSERGVYASVDGGETYRSLGLEGTYVHTLALQPYGAARTDLWAGLASTGGEVGCYCLQRVERPASEWQHFDRGWKGQTCYALAFSGPWVAAGTYDSGVMWLDPRAGQPGWQQHAFGALQDQGGKVRRVSALAVSGEREGGLVMASFEGGVARARAGSELSVCTQDVFSDEVQVPPEWLLCSGEHDITVSYEDEVRP